MGESKQDRGILSINGSKLTGSGSVKWTRK
jgi:hypothetical protein